jgi:hypothetical protein
MTAGESDGRATASKIAKRIFESARGHRRFGGQAEGFVLGLLEAGVCVAKGPAVGRALAFEGLDLVHPDLKGVQARQFSLVPASPAKGRFLKASHFPAALLIPHAYPIGQAGPFGLDRFGFLAAAERRVLGPAGHREERA